MLCNADTDVLNTPMEHPILTEHARVDLSSNRVRPLGITSLRDVLSHVSSYYTGCEDDVKFIVGAMAIKLKQLVLEGVKNLREMSIDAENATQELVMSVTKDIICQYQSAFTARSGGFEFNGVSHLKIITPNKANLACASKSRWKRTKEVVIADMNKRRKDASHGSLVLHSTVDLVMGSINAVTNTKTNRKFGFCMETNGETILSKEKGTSEEW